LLSIIQAAGWPIWPLILCSVVALALVIERFMRLRPLQVAPPNLLDEVIGVTRANLPPADVVNKLADNSVLGAVLAAGLRSVIAEPRITEPALRQAFENAGRVAVHGLERYLNTLGTIAAAAPLAGPVRHRGGHDRDLWLAGARRQAAAPIRSNWRMAFRWRCTTPPSA
jgi:biopolymer transport protein ExbB